MATLNFFDLHQHVEGGQRLAFILEESGREALSHTPRNMDHLANPTLWRWVRIMVARRVPASDVDDVVQTIALRAVKHADQYNADKGAVTTWLWWMIQEAVRRYHVLGRRHACLPLEYPMAQAREPGPDDAAMEREAAAMLREAVARLPRRSREAMELHLQGLNCTQIGRVLKMTKQGAVHRLDRAKGLLRVELTCPLRPSLS